MQYWYICIYIFLKLLNFYIWIILLNKSNIGSDKTTRNLLPNGFYKFVVHNPKELEMLMMQNRLVIIPFKFSVLKFSLENIVLKLPTVCHPEFAKQLLSVLINLISELQTLVLNWELRKMLKWLFVTNTVLTFVIYYFSLFCSGDLFYVSIWCYTPVT